MTNVHDAAAYILEKLDTSVSTMKLQKLCFLSQAWTLALLNRELFPEDFQAWAKGPVCYPLFERHRGRYTVQSWSGNTAALGPRERIVVDAVLKNYGALNGLQLSDVTHLPGSPWDVARKAAQAADGESSNAVISKQVMLHYYAEKLIVPNAGSRYADEQARF